MKKYLGFLLTLLVALPILYNANNIFILNNKEAIAGNYIKNAAESRVIAAKIAVANNLSDLKLRDTELENLNAIKKTMVEPAKPLNQIEWYQHYFSHDLLGSILFILLDICFILSFIFFIKFVIVQKLNKKRRFYLYR